MRSQMQSKTLHQRVSTVNKTTQNHNSSSNFSSMSQDEDGMQSDSEDIEGELRSSLVPETIEISVEK